MKVDRNHRQTSRQELGVGGRLRHRLLSRKTSAMKPGLIVACSSEVMTRKSACGSYLDMHPRSTRLWLTVRLLIGASSASPRIQCGTSLFCYPGKSTHPIRRASDVSPPGPTHERASDVIACFQACPTNMQYHKCLPQPVSVMIKVRMDLPMPINLRFPHNHRMHPG